MVNLHSCFQLGSVIRPPLTAVLAYKDHNRLTFSLSPFEVASKKSCYISEAADKSGLQYQS